MSHISDMPPQLYLSKEHSGDQLTILSYHLWPVPFFVIMFFLAVSLHFAIYYLFASWWQYLQLVFLHFMLPVFLSIQTLSFFPSNSSFFQWFLLWVLTEIFSYSLILCYFHPFIHTWKFGHNTTHSYHIILELYSIMIGLIWFVFGFSCPSQISYVIIFDCVGFVECNLIT